MLIVSNVLVCLKEIYSSKRMLFRRSGPFDSPPKITQFGRKEGRPFEGGRRPAVFIVCLTYFGPKKQHETLQPDFSPVIYPFPCSRHSDGLLERRCGRRPGAGRGGLVRLPHLGRGRT